MESLASAFFVVILCIYLLKRFSCVLHAIQIYQKGNIRKLFWFVYENNLIFNVKLKQQALNA